MGEPASKSNSRRLVTLKGRVAFIKSAKALSYVQAFRLQCPKLPIPMEGDLVIWARIWYASRRPDLDESVILDALQGLVIENDRQIREKHIYWGLDRDRPRTEIVVAPIGTTHPFPSG